MSLLSNAQLLKEELGHLTSDREAGDGDGDVNGVMVGIPSHACGRLDLSWPGKAPRGFGFAQAERTRVACREVHPNTGQPVHEKVEAHDGGELEMDPLRRRRAAPPRPPAFTHR